MAVSTGIIRSMDDLGRIVIPKEIRRVLEIDTGTPMDISVDYDKGEIYLKKFAERPDYKAMWEEAVKSGKMSQHAVEFLETKYISGRG